MSPVIVILGITLSFRWAALFIFIKTQGNKTHCYKHILAHMHRTLYTQLNSPFADLITSPAVIIFS